MNEWNDAELFAKMKAGNEEALATLFIRHYEHLKHFGNKIIPDSSLVEDCIQELFIYLFESHERLGNVKLVKAYLFRSLRRRLVEKAQKERRRKEGYANEFLKETDILFSPADLFLEKESQQRLYRTLARDLNQLPWRQREAIYLRYHNGLSTKEIAEVMGIANQTVLNTLHQALTRIRKNTELKKVFQVLALGGLFLNHLYWWIY